MATGTVSVLAITICYTLTAAELLARATTAHKRVRTFNPTALPKPRSLHFQKGKLITAREDPARRHNPTSTNTETLDTTRPFQRNERLDISGTSTVTTCRC